MGWSRDTLWAVDFGRLHLFDAQLTWARTITPTSIATPAGIARILPGPVLADGNLVGIPIANDGTRTMPVVLISEAGAILRTLAAVSAPAPTVRVTFPNNQFANVGNPWPDHALWLSEASGQSILIVNRPTPGRAGEATFEILRIGLRGDTLMRREVSYTVMAVSPEASTRVFAELGERYARRFSLPAARAERDVREVLTLPRFRPPVSELVLGRDATIWLRREDLPSDSVDWQVFTESGATLGRLRMPGSFKLHRAQADRLWGVVRDSMDVPFIQVYDVHRSDN
jgi:hypothetical protein